MNYKDIKGKILILGDSITDDGRFVSYLNTFMKLNGRESDVVFYNLGVSSETISGLSEEEHPFPRPCVFGRLEKALSVLQPDCVITLYGINDAIYAPFTKEYFDSFCQGYIKLATIIKKYKALHIALTPIPFDKKSFNGKLVECPPYGYTATYVEYDEVMKKYAEWMMANMRNYCDQVVDLHTPISTERAKLYAKNANAKTGDGIHPDEQGHYCIAKILMREIFGTEVCETDAKYQKKYFKLYKIMRQKDILLHRNIKEKIGHDNIYKDTVMQEDELTAKTKKMSERISKKCLKFEKKSTWKGYKCVRFYFEGRSGIIVFPKNENKDNKWIYRTEFFGAFDTADMAMVEQGYYLFNLDISNQFGAPRSVEIMDRFIAFLTLKYTLNEKGILFGFSRGGLYAIHYAAKYPEKVAAMYLDAPVVSVKSWPFGMGKGSYSEVDCKLCIASYNMTNVKEYDVILSSALANLKSSKIPLIIVAGDSDEVVPYEENGILLQKIWQDNGISFELILKEGCKHHPHSLENPQKIVNFLLKV